MIQLTQRSEGIVLPVRAQPAARRNEIVGEQNGALKIAVTAPPDQGKANRAILEVLADYLGCKRSQLEILMGQTSRDKKVLVRDLSVERIRERMNMR